MFNKRNKLVKRLMQATDAEDVTRNHAYSRVARSHRPVPVRRPSAGGQSASAYRNSMVGSTAQYRERIPPRPKAAEKKESGAASDSRVIGNRPASGSSDKGKTGGDLHERRHHFVEPPRRNFNRFG